MKWLRWLAAKIIALYTKALYLSCRFYHNNDCRPELRRQGKNYIFAVLHAHQVGGLMGHGERKAAVMVSKSADGDLVVGALQAHRFETIRGSSRKGDVDKGGATARDAMITWLREGIFPATLTVDGPRGPRGIAKKGVAQIAMRSGAAILPAVVVPSRRHVLRGTWDHLQIPKCFSRVDIFFGSPIYPEGEETEDALKTLQELTEERLRHMEERYDPQEARRHRSS